METCYNIRYPSRTFGSHQFEETAVYHRSCASTGQSVWVLLKASSLLRERLCTRLKHEAHRAQAPEHRDLALHALVICFALQSWSGFVDRRPSPPKFETSAPNASATNTSTFQTKTSWTTGSVLDAISIMDATIHLAGRIRNLVDQCQLRNELQQALATELEEYEAEARHYRKTLGYLQAEAHEYRTTSKDEQDIRNMAVTMLQSQAEAEECRRNHETVVESKMEIFKQIYLVLRRGEGANIRAGRVPWNQTALGVVGTLYLPASLLAAIFSSNLVHVDSEGAFEASPQFWKFVVWLLPLTALTLLGPVLVALGRAYLAYRAENNGYKAINNSKKSRPNDSAV